MGYIVAIGGTLIVAVPGTLIGAYLVWKNNKTLLLKWYITAVGIKEKEQEFVSGVEALVNNLKPKA